MKTALKDFFSFTLDAMLHNTVQIISLHFRVLKENLEMLVGEVVEKVEDLG